MKLMLVLIRIHCCYCCSTLVLCRKIVSNVQSPCHCQTVRSPASSHCRSCRPSCLCYNTSQPALSRLCCCLVRPSAAHRASSNKQNLPDCWTCYILITCHVPEATSAAPQATQQQADKASMTVVRMLTLLLCRCKSGCLYCQTS